MKLITLVAPTTINNVVVMPVQGPQIVTDEQAAELAAHELLDGEPVDLGDDGAPVELPAAEKPARASRGK